MTQGHTTYRCTSTEGVYQHHTPCTRTEVLTPSPRSSPAKKKQPPAIRQPTRQGKLCPGLQSTAVISCCCSWYLAQATVSARNAHRIANLTTAPTTAGKQDSFTKLLKGPEAKIWGRSFANKWGQFILPHDLGITCLLTKQVKGTGTLFFMEKSQVPKDQERHLRHRKQKVEQQCITTSRLLAQQQPNELRHQHPLPNHQELRVISS
jgi:hypothetical protein